MAAIAPSTLTGSGRPNCSSRAVERPLDGAQQPDVLALELELQRHLEQARRARIARVEAMAEAGRRFAVPQALVDDRRRPPPATSARLRISVSPASRNRMHDSMSPP